MFVHGPNVLIDTPAEIAEQLKRSTVTDIAACFYSHWHPDHTMGRGVFSPMNIGYPSWPYRPRRTTPIYLPRQVAADARIHLSIWDHLKQMEKDEHVVEIHELEDDATVEISGVSIRTLRLHEDFVYAFLLETEGKRLLVVADELLGWEPPDAVRGVDLAVLPLGVSEFNPLTGRRQIPEGHPVLALEATFEGMLEVVGKLDAGRVVITHIEEPEQLSYDDLAALARKLSADGIDLTFAYDTLLVDV